MKSVRESEGDVNFQISLIVDSFAVACLHEADILLLDLAHPDATDELRWNLLTLAHPKMPIIALFRTYGLALRLALAKGVHGFLLRDSGDAALLQALREVPQGFCVVPESLISQLTRRKTSPVNPKLSEPLTKRELEILELLAHGLRNKDISHGLFLTEQSVKNRLRDIYGKLGVSNRLQAVLRARELELIG